MSTLNSESLLSLLVETDSPNARACCLDLIADWESSDGTDFDGDIMVPHIAITDDSNPAFDVAPTPVKKFDDIRDHHRKVDLREHFKVTKKRQRHSHKAAVMFGALCGFVAGFVASHAY